MSETAQLIGLLREQMQAEAEQMQAKRQQHKEQMEVLLKTLAEHQNVPTVINASTSTPTFSPLTTLQSYVRAIGRCFSHLLPQIQFLE